MALTPESTQNGDATRAEEEAQMPSAVRQAIEKFSGYKTSMSSNVADADMRSDTVLESSLGWCLVQRDPYGEGLNVRGGMTMELEVSTRSAVASIGRVLACGPALDDQGKPVANILKGMWVDILLRHIPGSANDSPKMRGLSVIEVSAYESDVTSPTMEAQDALFGANTEPGQNVQTQRSFTVPLAFSTALTLQILFQEGSLLLRMQNTNTSEALVEMRIARFGHCMPMVKLRSGRQPFTSGVTHASFTQKATTTLQKMPASDSLRTYRH
jgi:hypothetical protein